MPTMVDRLAWLLSQMNATCTASERVSLPPIHDGRTQALNNWAVIWVRSLTDKILRLKPSCDVFDLV